MRTRATIPEAIFYVAHGAVRTLWLRLLAQAAFGLIGKTNASTRLTGFHGCSESENQLLELQGDRFRTPACLFAMAEKEKEKENEKPALRPAPAELKRFTLVVAIFALMNGMIGTFVQDCTDDKLWC